ncbi:MAG: glycosyl hydrolase family 8, partial [Pseudomonadota bacterium]
MTRPLRWGIAVVSLTVVGARAATPSALDQRDWRQYRTSFITAEGRVLDTGNQGISHSEGQGYAMLLAEAYGDAIQFDRLWRWTRTHLQVRDDHLFAWRWEPSDAGGAVADTNSASDGDILIALALARAAQRWDVPSYEKAAAAIASDVLERLVRPVEAWSVLLPGAKGFVHDAVVTVNPSYWVFPALQELDRV